MSDAECNAKFVLRLLRRARLIVLREIDEEFE